jgi:FkbM family methyltransferase
MLFELWKDPSHYDEDLVFYKLFLKPGDVFVDVGANIGLVSLIAGKIVGQKGLVISIEGFPTTYSHLEENIALNRCLNIKSYNCAIGLEETYLSFFRNIFDDSRNCISETGNVQIPVSRLDTVINFLDHIDLLKIDVEGYEKFVILGATEVLERVNTIYFESWQRLQSMYNYTLDEIIMVLKKFGFIVYRFRDNKSIQIIKKGYTSTTLDNLIATRNSRDLLNRTKLKIVDV